MISIRKARIEEIDQLMLLFEQGRGIMRRSGNLKQWVNGYPTRELIAQDIAQGYSYVCTDETGQAVGTFAFIPGKDPTYARIYDGEWLDDARPYGAIHRLAGSEAGKGIARACLEWCYRQLPNLRADTHRDNRIMQHILLKQGFRYCGIIYLQNGDERLAYQRL